MKEYNSIKIDRFTYEVLVGAKGFTGVPISRIVADLVEKQFPNKYKGVVKELNK